jgi:hypothetical protein
MQSLNYTTLDASIFKSSYRFPYRNFSVFPPYKQEIDMYWLIVVMILGIIAIVIVMEMQPGRSV